MVFTEQDFIELCNNLLQSKGFVFCPGIGYQHYKDNYYSVIRFHKNDIKFATCPFQHVDVVGCSLWYKLPKNATMQQQASNEV